MAPVIVFSNASSPAHPRMYIATSDAPAADIGFVVWIAPAQASSLPSTLSLAQVWQLQFQSSPIIGHMAISSTTPTDLGAYFLKLEALFALSPFAERTAMSYAWITNPQASAFLPADTPALLMDKSSPDASPNGPFILVVDGSHFQMGKYANFDLSSHIISDLTSDLSGIRFRQFTNLSAFTFVVQASRNQGFIGQNMVLPLFGPGKGSLLFDMSLKGGNGLNDLGANIEYYYSEPVTQQLIRLGYPIVPDGEGATGLQFRMAMDPSDPFNISYSAVDKTGNLRTYLAFTSVEGVNPVFNSWFRTDTGAVVQLQPDLEVVPGEYATPSPNAGLLVFGQITEGNSAATLTFQGDFVLSVVRTAIPPAVGTPHNLLCGLSGTETLTFFPADTAPLAPDRMIFAPGAIGFSPSYPPVPISLAMGVPTGKKLPPLDDEAYSTGIRLDARNEIPALYTSQPQAAPLFAKDHGVNNASNPTFLGYFEPSIGVSSAPGFSFPMVPYAGLGSSSMFGNYQDFEANILNPARKSAISGAATQHVASRARLLSGSLDDSPIPSTTPQGFISTVNGDGSWASVLLAKNVDDSQTFLIQFLNLLPELQSAFQTNQQFLVVTEGRFLGVPMDQHGQPGADPAFQKSMQIQDWPFELNVGIGNSFSNYQNVMIFKFGEGKLEDLVKDPNLWTSATDFAVPAGSTNPLGDLAAVSSWIQDYIATAKQNATYDPEYFEGFVRRVSDPNWNGVLVLKADINLIDFPAGLQGLLGGIDTTRLNAHHFGIEVNKVNNQVELVDNSSLFGLIYYLDKAYEAQLRAGSSPDDPVSPAPGEYDFKVLSLKVLFENTAIRNFNSKSQLTMNVLFGDNAVRQEGDRVPNTIVFNGTYQDLDGEPVYTFTATDVNKLFSFDSNLLNGMYVSNASFNTLNNQGESSTMVTSRFSLTGFLNYRPIPGFDIFSFGTASGEPSFGSGLFYSNVFIAMQFDVTTPTARQFLFDASHVSFDLARSTPRPQSLYPNFALTLSNMAGGNEENLPKSLGFLNATLPIRSNRVEGQWFGLQMNLNLGTPGALVSGAGFKSSLILVWFPGEKKDSDVYNVMVGVKLPGTANDAKLLSIQGVLKVSVSQIRMLFDADTTSFQLFLGDIGLKFLGFVKLPPNGNINFFLFGNPDGGARTESLGWYAAYNQDVNASLCKQPTDAQDTLMLPQSDTPQY